MARIRTVKPELFRHERLYEAEKHYGLPLRLVFIGLFTVCDREGRFKWRPRELKLDILPYDEMDFSAALNALLETGFIKAYEVNEIVYGFIPSWNKHQVINNRERQSDLPEPEPPFIIAAPMTRASRVIDVTPTPLLSAQEEGKEKGTGREKDIYKVSDETSPPSFFGNELLASTHELEDSLLNNEHEDSAFQVFTYWQAKMNHPKAKFDKKRRSQIQAALKLGFELEQLKQAIDGCARTPFNMGQNKDAQRYDSIELIFRDAEHIERFIQNALADNDHTSLSVAVSQIDQISEGAI